ncbi:hypothetical protein GJ629_14550 [Halapricum sp. CBA1109]|uniref:hypothetical protein n=1 Tax=Halapricum sp. CBA1109 TaxID=2668068 RepID=UPI0012FC13B5|nr:hypothetical protein [Halapricum sp. CBA1109]MUV90959.1 hypothetical protein [Halapricum sp. CBA1109]
MVDISRRRLLAVGSAVALTGCMGGADTDAETTDGGDSTTAPTGSRSDATETESVVPDAIRTALAPVPTSVDAGRSPRSDSLARPTFPKTTRSPSRLERSISPPRTPTTLWSRRTTTVVSAC